MRRKDREIIDSAKIDKIISSCQCCRIGFQDGDGVYIVPLNFGYVHEGDQRIFYFHGACKGHKIDLAKEAPNVGFELDTQYALRTADAACNFTNTYQSIIGCGVIEIVEDLPEKERGLRSLMEQSTGKDCWTFIPAMLNSVIVLKLTVKELSCKERT